MSAVTVSRKYQVVIPKDIRQSLGIQPGQKLDVYCLEGIVQLVPIKDIRSMRGSLPDLDTHVERSDRDSV